MNRIELTLKVKVSIDHDDARVVDDNYLTCSVAEILDGVIINDPMHGQIKVDESKLTDFNPMKE